MTFEELKRVNATLKTTDIKGKEYVEVNTRVLAFRELYPEGTITTELLSNNDGICIMKAHVYDGEKLLATGLAYEKESSSYINKTSYIENCETSAVGRALGFLGIGITGSIRSAEEMQNAEDQKEFDKIQKSRSEIIDMKTAEILEKTLKRKNVNIEKLLQQYKVDALTDITTEQYSDIFRRLNEAEPK